MAMVTTGRITLQLPGQAPIALTGDVVLPAPAGAEAARLPDPSGLSPTCTFRITPEGHRTLMVAAIVQDALATARRILD